MNDEEYENALTQAKASPNHTGSIETGIGASHAFKVDDNVNSAVVQLANVVAGIVTSSSTLPKEMVGDSPEGYHSGEELVIISGPIYDQRGERMESRWGHMDDAIAIKLSNPQVVLDLVVSALMTVLDEETLQIAGEALTALITTAVTSGKLSHLQQTLVDTYAAEGHATMLGTDDGTMKTATPSPHAFQNWEE